MKKLFAVIVLSVLLGGASGCRIGECWNQACCSHCQQPQRTVVVAEQPCVVTDSCCTSCGTPCGTPCNAVPMVTPGR